jgi:hypothetical protein
VANIYLTDGGYSRINWANPYEQGFTTDWNSTTKKWNTITKTGFTTSVAAGDYLIVALASTASNVWYEEAYCKVQSVTSSTITFVNSSLVWNTGGSYTKAWITKPVINIADTSNYYSTTYAIIPCPNPCGTCPPTYGPGTAYPFALNPATDTLILVPPAPGAIGSTNVFGSNVSVQTPFPIPPQSGFVGALALSNSGTWSVPISSVVNNGSTQAYAVNIYALSGGTFTIPLTLTGLGIQSGTYTNTVSVGVTGNIGGGTFSNTVTLTSVSSVSSITPPPTISGGTFTSLVSRVNPSYTGSVLAGNVITGGTYSPTATCAISNGQLVTTNLPTDPGFKVGGGTFSPIINLSGSRNSVLGAGFP